ncbi:MAG: CHAT domain-containing protein [Bacteroidia bacterium]|nr:CHAT domain-containing protein [Bacteroidia bacterium]
MKNTIRPQSFLGKVAQVVNVYNKLSPKTKTIANEIINSVLKEQLGTVGITVSSSNVNATQSNTSEATHTHSEDQKLLNRPTQVRPSALFTFAANDLSGVQDEAHKIWTSASQSSLVSATKIEHASIERLADAIIDSQALFMFHFGGHADQHRVVLDGLLGLDKIRLSRLIAPDGHQIQLMFLNGCLSYGQVGLLTAKGVKAIIATNVEVHDAEAGRIAAYFYKLFFEKGKTLKSAFETAEATVSGRNAYPIIVNPGEIDEHQPMPSSWTLFVNDQHKEVMDWTLADFVASAQQTAAGQKQNGGPSRTVQQHGDKSVYIEDHTGDITIS